MSTDLHAQARAAAAEAERLARAADEQTRKLRAARQSGRERNRKAQAERLRDEAQRTNAVLTGVVTDPKATLSDLFDAFGAARVAGHAAAMLAGGSDARDLTFERVVAQAMANRMARALRAEEATLSAADDVTDADAEASIG